MWGSTGLLRPGRNFCRRRLPAIARSQWHVFPAAILALPPASGRMLFCQRLTLAAPSPRLASHQVDGGLRRRTFAHALHFLRSVPASYYASAALLKRTMPRVAVDGKKESLMLS